MFVIIKPFKIVYGKRYLKQGTNYMYLQFRGQTAAQYLLLSYKDFLEIDDRQLPNKKMEKDIEKQFTEEQIQMTNNFFNFIRTFILQKFRFILTAR